MGIRGAGAGEGGDVLVLCFAQTGQYSTQIFSLAVLLSSLFVYNQMGGIDEAALDRLSLVTEVRWPRPLRCDRCKIAASKLLESIARKNLLRHLLWMPRQL